MLDQSRENIERHIKTHSERSNDDRAAVSVLETFLRSNGRINTSFASDDKWPNHDGTFEFVPDPDVSRQPKQTFYVQIKGTHNYSESEVVIKYSLKDLAFPAFICNEVSFDPGITGVPKQCRKLLLAFLKKPYDKRVYRLLRKNYVKARYKSTKFYLTNRSVFKSPDFKMRSFTALAI